MRFVIDTSGMRFVVVAPGSRCGAMRRTGRASAWPLGRDEDGEVLWRAPLVALGDDVGTSCG